jgi:hypothetical protein
MSPVVNLCKTSEGQLPKRVRSFKVKMKYVRDGMKMKYVRDGMKMKYVRDGMKMKYVRDGMKIACNPSH